MGLDLGALLVGPPLGLNLEPLGLNLGALPVGLLVGPHVGIPLRPRLRLILRDLRDPLSL